MRRRIEGVAAAGIWISWDRMIQASSNLYTWRLSSSLHLSAQTMNGHILVVFLVLIVGVILSAILFVLEIIKKQPNWPVFKFSVISIAALFIGRKLIKIMGIKNGSF